MINKLDITDTICLALMYRKDALKFKWNRIFSCVDNGSKAVSVPFVTRFGGYDFYRDLVEELNRKWYGKQLKVYSAYAYQDGYVVIRLISN